MRVTESHFKAILAELIDENPIACQGLLRISTVVFTRDVATLAVTLEARPQLQVNLEFINTSCANETHVKAVILHEFLHVLLNHTQAFEEMTPLLNLALDSVINAMIHRLCGPAYSEMMAGYYAKAEGWARLLRPMTPEDFVTRPGPEPEFRSLWLKLYAGEVLAEDILALSQQFGGSQDNAGLPPGTFLLGDHRAKRRKLREEELPAYIREALKRTFDSLNRDGIWHRGRSTDLGHGGLLEARAKDERVVRWERTAWLALKECLAPDRRKRYQEMESDRIALLPVLNERDRRGFVRAIWSPLIPEIAWNTSRKLPGKSTQVYLDVSGSMHDELQSLVGLLQHFRRYIRMPFWAFSDQVSQATIEEGRLRTTSTGGTQINPVFRHLIDTRPKGALIITDGYTEACDRLLLEQLQGVTIRAIVSRSGATSTLDRAGIACRQLEEFGL